MPHVLMSPETMTLLKRIKNNPDVEATPEELWKSRIRSQYELECAIFEAFYKYPDDPQASGYLSIWALPDDDRHAIKVLSENAWNKLEPILAEYAITCGKGIYEVRLAWHRVGWLNADCDDSAMRQAETMYSWLKSIYRPEAPERCRFRVLWAYDSDGDLLRNLEKDLAEVNLSAIKQEEKRIAESEERMRWLRAVAAVSPSTGSKEGS